MQIACNAHYTYDARGHGVAEHGRENRVSAPMPERRFLTVEVAPSGLGEIPQQMPSSCPPLVVDWPNLARCRHTLAIVGQLGPGLDFFAARHRRLRLNTPLSYHPRIDPRALMSKGSFLCVRGRRCSGGWGWSGGSELPKAGSRRDLALPARIAKKWFRVPSRSGRGRRDWLGTSRPNRLGTRLSRRSPSLKRHISSRAEP